MSYIAPSAAAVKRLQIAEITLSGSPSANGYFTFATLVDHTFDTAPTLNSTVLTLPAGSYMLRACLDVTRTNGNHNYQFQFEADGALIGRIGHTGIYNNIRADVCEAAYRSTSAIALKLEATAIEGSAPTLTADSKLFIWRADS